MSKSLAAALAITVVTGAAAAQELRFASGYPPTSPAYKATEAFVAHVEANSDMTVNVFHSGSLLPFPEIPTGLRDGIADIGVILPPYYPSEFPESNLAANLSMLTHVGERVAAPGAAMAGAMMDYVFDCADCQEGYRSKNQVYLGALSSSTFDLLCKEPVRTPGDLAGRKVRVGAANFGRYVEHHGGVQVAMPANEMYEAMAQGVVDCAVLSVADLTGYQMADVVDYAMVDVPGGVYSGVDPQNFNLETWSGLTDAQRQVILEAAARGSAAATAQYFIEARSAAEGAQGMGVEIVKPSAEMLAATGAFFEVDLPVIKSQFTTEFGVEDVDAKIEEITALVEKWKGLTAEWDGTPETLAQIYWDELFSTLDPATYGM